MTLHEWSTVMLDLKCLREILKIILIIVSTQREVDVQGIIN